MPLRESPFSNGLARALHALGWALVFPCFWFLDRLLAACKSTSLERRRRREEECYLHPLRVVFGSLLFLLLFLASAPFALLGFVLWAPLQYARRPFSYRRQEVSVRVPDRNSGWERSGKVTFGFASANLCLLPDGLARFNNLAQTQRRAAAIGQSIVQGVARPHIRIFIDSPSSGGAMSPSNSLLPAAGAGSYGATASQSANGPAETRERAADAQDAEALQTPATPAAVDEPPDRTGVPNQRNSGRTAPIEVSCLFPASVDVVCLQEVFDKRAAARMAALLGPLFGHVLYDVGVYACSAGSSFKFFNSGLLVASRFPVVDAAYRCFPNGRGEDALAAKGLLSVKVDTGLTNGDKKMVGFLNCTHLHAPEGDGAIRCEQLDMLSEWIAAFQAETRQQDEAVVFDVLCGDFNFDNCSPDDGLEQRHGVFLHYTDPCRAGPGREKPWVIGTLLQQPSLYHAHVRTPESLQRTLESEELRKIYLAPPIPKGDAPFEYPEPGEPWVGRRIDYLLYRDGTCADSCRTELEEFTYVTQLAGLTDHIPVGLRINVTLESTGAEPEP